MVHTFFVRVHVVCNNTAKPGQHGGRRAVHSPQPIAPTTDGRGRGLRSAIAPGGSCAASGAGAVEAIRIGCRRNVYSNGLGGTLPPELGRLTDLVAL